MPKKVNKKDAILLSEIILNELPSEIHIVCNLRQNYVNTFILSGDGEPIIKDVLLNYKKFINKLKPLLERYYDSAIYEHDKNDRRKYVTYSKGETIRVVYTLN